MILQPEDSSHLEDSDFLDAESDHITEPSDNGDIESSDPPPDAQGARDQRAWTWAWSW